MVKTLVMGGGYYDSLALMDITVKIGAIDGIRNAVAVMGTDLNKTVVGDFGGMTDEAAAASPNDLIIGVQIDDETKWDWQLTQIKRQLEQKNAEAGETPEAEITYVSLKRAIDARPEANLAFISVPGEYAAREAMQAIQRGLNVFIFSDHVRLEDEVKLKQMAEAKGLLVMGPGCGVSIINNVSLGLMSKVSRGNIGIVGASGSGIHEIAMLATNHGYGISQAIGTGGRDLSQEVGGITMRQGFRYLEKDQNTKVIVLVSKPPHPDTEAKILQMVSDCSKPVIVFFLGGDTARAKAAGAYCPATLEEAAQMAMKLASGTKVTGTDFSGECRNALGPVAAEEKAKLAASQKYIRGIFCGGTHSEEAILMLRSMVELHSNLNFGGVKVLADARASSGNSVVDVGDEIFTKGKPHPVMDPSILCDRLRQESNDPEVAVILFDLLLGHGAHADPFGTIEQTIWEIREKAAKAGRHLSLVASVCGTEFDPQGLAAQKRRMEEAGILLAESNSRAAILSGLIVSGARC